MNGKYIIPFLLMLLYSGIRAQKLPVADVFTSKGKIVLEIDTIHSPVTGNNFLELIRNGVFSKAMFYRVVRPDNQPGKKTKIEVIQGGLYSESIIEKYILILHETTIKTGLKHLDGTVSMARNEPGTASTEFFICIGDQPELDFGGMRNPDGQGFAAFGKVIKGMNNVRRIQQLPDEEQYLGKPVKIRKIRLR